MAEPGVILFDFGGTLDADGVRWSQRFHAAYAAEGGSLNAVAFEPLFRRSDAELAAMPDTRALGFTGHVRTQARLLVDLLPDGGRVDAARLAQAFLDEAAFTIARNRRVLERLARTQRLGVVSNFTGNLARCLEELGLGACFEVVADSGVVGWSKPDERLFRHALDAIGVEPARVWMVGDNPQSDIAPALHLGMRACWITPAHRNDRLPVPPTARISMLTELPAVVL